MATVAITGANSGIGLRAAQQLSTQGHRVLALCRSVERGRAALGDSAEVIECDTSSLASVERAAAQVADIGVDALINNAAVFDLGMKQRQLSADGHELVWATDHLGAWALTGRLSGALAATGGRVVFIASKGLLAQPGARIRFDDVGGEGWYTPTKAYYQAKLAQIMTAMSVAEKAQGRFSVACLRVPAVRLDAAKLAAQPKLYQWAYAPKNAKAAAPEAVAQSYVRLALGQPIDEVYVDEGLQPVSVPKFARDAANRARLWELSTATTGMEWQL
jgi:NAD(P)-dependent dehydrogenase (short-subunit alcohol dehydrogenase family)